MTVGQIKQKTNKGVGETIQIETSNIKTKKKIIYLIQNVFNVYILFLVRTLLVIIGTY